MQVSGACSPVFAAPASPSVTAVWRVLSQAPAARGRTELALDVSIAPGWHVNAHEPDRPYLIATDLELSPPAAAAVERIVYPEPVVRRLAFARGEPLRLYDGSFTMTVTLAGTLPPEIAGRLRYQACNEETCLPPRTLPVSFRFDGGGAPRVPGSAAHAPREAAGATIFETWMRDLGLAATLALAALVGLGLNLTPCVYPLISVTIAFFGGQSHHAPTRVAALALCYVLGIALTFSILGVAAALSGGLFGSALQRPSVLAVVAIVLVALAASNFGLYQLRVPTALTQRAGKASAGLVGALAMGVTMGVVAAPCVGTTLIALLLFVAARQDVALGFVLFLAVALGMGLPYLGLAMAAGSIRRLPQSGEWLVWVERLFGFVLLGMALHFAAPLLGPRVVGLAMPALVAAAGLYLGFIDRAGRSLVSFVLMRRVFGVAALGAALWLAVPHQADSAIAWRSFSSASLADAAQSGKPAIVDFTAEWCLPCRENDHVTFTHPGVTAEAERFVMLRADVTRVGDEVDEWMTRHAVLGVPTLIFYDSGGAEVARAVGFVAPERMLDLMREGR